MLKDYCVINKLINPNFDIFLGIAAQTRTDDTPISRAFFEEGQDFVLFDGSEWDENSYSHAKDIHEEYIEHGLLAKRKLSTQYISEFPNISSDEINFRRNITLKGSDRNKPCICGSGKKLKKCCGK